MIKPELVQQIKAQLRFGTDQETLFHSLTLEGWSKDDIEDSFIAASSERQAAIPTEPEAHFITAENPDELPPLQASAIFGKSWDLYKSRWKTFLGIVLLPALIGLLVGLSVLMSGIFANIDPQHVTAAFLLPFFSMLILLYVPLFILQLWSQTALIYAIKGSAEGIGVEESYRRSYAKLGSVIWVSLLSAAIVAGGAVFFLIPAIVLSIWFTFIMFIVIDEDLRGMDVLLKSREYVRGRGWELIGIFFYLGLYAVGLAIILGLATALLSALVSALCVTLGVTDWQTLMAHWSKGDYQVDFSFLLTPLFTAFSYFVYRIFKQEKGEFAFAPTAETKKKYAALGVFGVAVYGSLAVFLFFIFSRAFFRGL